LYDGMARAQSAWNSGIAYFVSMNDMGKRAKRIGLALIPVVIGGIYAGWQYLSSSLEAEMERLAGLLALEKGMTVADVGAGGGRMSVLIAKRLGPSGRVFSTEMEEKNLDKIRKAASDAGLANINVIRGGEQSTNLPAGCCNAVFMRKVYHHITDPEAINRTLFEAVRPGGKLAVIDFEKPWMLWLPRPDGIPQDRPGHGVPPAVVIKEMQQAGFTLEHRIDDWPERNFCLIFHKP